MKMRMWFYTNLLALLTLVSVSASASSSPDVLIRDTTEKLLAELSANRQALMDDSQRLYRLVDEVVLPHFDFKRMSQLVLGRYWRQATEAQQQQFVEQFKALLVRTYATALFEYTDQEIEYKPFRADEKENVAVVKTEVLQPGGGPRIPFHYSLLKDGNNDWKVFDVRVDGISLVTNYRTSYARLIQTNGLDSLISSLADKNKTVTQ